MAIVLEVEDGKFDILIISLQAFQRRGRGENEPPIRHPRTRSLNHGVNYKWGNRRVSYFSITAQPRG